MLLTDRSAQWRCLVSCVETAGPGSPDQMAFILMLARLNGCATCNIDSYRAMLGCIACAKQSLKRFHGTDEELSGLFETAKSEVCLFLQKNQ
jgi:hypothetical protein